tara:strand:+ start:10310 stop:10654 length:345 start_codon:yes stop_codon:yes gene_type:complete
LVKNRDFGAIGHEGAGFKVVNLRQCHVLADVHPKDKALSLAVLGHERNAPFNRIMGRRYPRLFTIQQDRAGRRISQAKQCFRNFRAARADKPIETDNLSAAHFKADILIEVTAT